MRKKVLVLISALAIGLSGTYTASMESNAQENLSEQNYSYLLTEDALIGEMNAQTRGVYLMSGTSIIRDGGTGKIIAGGITTASQPCKVTLNVIVERLVGSTWSRVTSWVASDSKDWSVMSSKTLSVGRGYYYRVRCLHSANSDASSSMTGGFWR